MHARHAKSAAIKGNGVSGPINAQPIRVEVCRAALTIRTGRNPNARRIGVVNGLIAMLPMNSGVSIRPDFTAS